ncbi:hypothetical protein ACFTQ7_04240 [Lysinibacillus sp. NPDC056959]|uniref:hypothetical protein n=1 Tax=Lysinibacillus sp. NPDC056959 TaxID=3345981 RepID=UPI00363062BF
MKTGKKLRELSEVYRTDIVHNGIDMFKNEFEKMKHNLLFLERIIVKCVNKLIESEAKSEEEFYEYIEKRKLELDVQPNQKLDKDKLVEDILKMYNEEDVINLSYDEWSEILNNVNKNFLVSTCVSLCTSLVGAYENIRQKVFDPISQYKCKTCTSKKLEIVDDEAGEDGIVKKLFLQCEECSDITEIIFR